MISVPNIHGFDTLSLGAEANAIDHEHLNYFNPDSLAILLERYSFTVEESLTPGRLDVDWSAGRSPKAPSRTRGPFVRHLIENRAERPRGIPGLPRREPALLAPLVGRRPGTPPDGAAVGAVVVARHGSERLPGKMLREFGGRPLLGHVLDRLARAGGPDGSSSRPVRAGDDDSRLVVRRAGVALSFAGPPRMSSAASSAPPRPAGFDAVARVNGDSPWLDPELLDRAIALFRAEAADLVTNLLERDWPYGISAEVAELPIAARRSMPKRARRIAST